MTEGIESDLAADKALRRITRMEVLRQLRLFDTVIQLYSLEAISDLEKEILGNPYNPELQRKDYLLTNVVPRKGPYKGMQSLRQALKQSEQYEVLKILDKAYKDALDAIMANERSQDASDPSLAPRSDSVSSSNASVGDPDESTVTGRNTSMSDSSQSSSDEYEPTSSPQQQLTIVQQQPLSPSPSSSRIIIDVQSTTAVSVTTSVTTEVTAVPHRKRSGHISFESNPYKPNLEQNVSVTIINGEDTPHHDGDINTEQVQCSREETVRRVGKEASPMKFVIVGDTATGKTSLLRRYISNKFSIARDTSTLLDVQSTELTCYNINYKLYLWDTAGQERFQALTRAYYRDAVGGFVVYDVTDRTSLEHCMQWKKEIDNVVQLLNGDPIPIVLIANKVDLGHLDGKHFSKQHGFTNYFETSAKTGVGIKEAIHFMVKKVHELSCANDELVIQTLSKNPSIKLHTIHTDVHENARVKKCCT